MQVINLTSFSLSSPGTHGSISWSNLPFSRQCNICRLLMRFWMFLEFRRKPDAHQISTLLLTGMPYLYTNDSKYWPLEEYTSYTIDRLFRRLRSQTAFENRRNFRIIQCGESIITWTCNLFYFRTYFCILEIDLWTFHLNIMNSPNMFAHCWLHILNKRFQIHQQNLRVSLLHYPAYDVLQSCFQDLVVSDSVAHHQWILWHLNKKQREKIIY